MELLTIFQAKGDISVACCNFQDARFTNRRFSAIEAISGNNSNP
jgi:hypothetical protein